MHTNHFLRPVVYTVAALTVATALCLSSQDTNRKVLIPDSLSTPAHFATVQAVGKVPAPSAREEVHHPFQLMPGQGGWIKVEEVLAENQKNIFVPVLVDLYSQQTASHPFRLSCTSTGWSLKYSGKKPFHVKATPIGNPDGLLWITHVSGFTVTR
jgi:hypothetical protein